MEVDVTRYEQMLQRDMTRIRSKVREMGQLTERALNAALKALASRNPQLAGAVILRDHRVDTLEREIDRLCLEFIVRHQPVADAVRFVYAAIKLNGELERIGDYAESIARQVVRLNGLHFDLPGARFAELAGHAIPMLHAAMEAFFNQDAAQAESAARVEDLIDRLRFQLNAELVDLQQQRQLPLEALSPLLTIANRFERVGDQARNICHEVVYMCKGEYLKHVGSDSYRLLFVDEHNSCRGQMAEAIGRSLGAPEFVFDSAGLDRRSVDGDTIAFLRGRGLDISRHTSKALDQIPSLSQYQIIVALAEEAQRVFPPPPTKAVCLDWSVRDPSAVPAPADRQVAYEETYLFLQSHLQTLVHEVLA
jgi:phosphate transport system protein